MLSKILLKLLPRILKEKMEMKIAQFQKFVTKPGKRVEKSVRRDL